MQLFKVPFKGYVIVEAEKFDEACEMVDGGLQCYPDDDNLAENALVHWWIDRNTESQIVPRESLDN